MTTIYVNGVKVEKEDLKNMEITNEQVKRIFAEQLRGEEDEKGA